jgi:hypothetical protein
MLSTLILLLALLIAAGCVDGVRRIDMKWAPGAKPEAQMYQDRYECMQRHDGVDTFQACMEARGYKRIDSR